MRNIYLYFVIFLLISCNKSNPGVEKSNHDFAIPVSVKSVKSTSIPIYVEVVAQTEGAKEIEVRSRVGGIVIKRLYNEGDKIQAGQPMFLIDTMPFQLALEQAQASFLLQKAHLEQALREEKRLKELLSNQAVSQREYDNATTDTVTAKATAAQAEAALKQAQLNLSYCHVNAPQSGTSGRFRYSEGALVEANNSLLTTIAQLDPIWVRFSLSQNDIMQLGGSIRNSDIKNVSLILPSGKYYELNGKVNFSSSQIDPQIGTQQLRATFGNPKHELLPGQFVRVRITTGQREGVFLVPQVAVLTGELGKYVLLAEKDNKGKIIARPRPIKEGLWFEDQWVILEGLHNGDQVIVDNLMKLRPNLPVMPHPAR